MSTLYAEPVFIGKPKKERTEKQKASFEKAREALKRKREAKTAAPSKEQAAPEPAPKETKVQEPSEPAPTPETHKDPVKTPADLPKTAVENSGPKEEELVPPKWFKNFVKQAREEKLARPKRCKPAPPAPIDVPHTRSIKPPQTPAVKTIKPQVSDTSLYVPADYEAPKNPLYNSIFPNRK